MSYPTPSDYQEALQVPASAFADPDLQTAEPRTNVLGLPQPITGAFAAVFPMTTETGQRYAVKCFLSDVPDQRARYEAIAAHLDAHDLDATVQFEYQPEGVQVDGERYPLLKMEWVQGTTINRFVDAHREKPAVLARLARQWATTVQVLEDAQVAHGDLQHGNILVVRRDDGLRIRLVDYDTMYVPALEGRTAAEVGHRNYQHPDRTDADFGPRLDRFAGLVIYTALRACAVRPALWDRFDTGENLLFRDADFYTPGASPVFEALAAIDDLAPLPQVLRRACFVEPEAVPALQSVKQGDHSLDRLAVASGAFQRRRQEARGQARDGFARAFLPGAGAVLAGTVAIAAVGTLWAAGAGLGAALIAAGWEVARRYRQLPVVRRRRRLQQEIDRITDLIAGLQRQIESLKAKRQTVLDTVDEQRAARLQELQEEALYDRLKHHFIGEVRQVEHITHKHVVRLKSANIRTAYEAKPENIEAIRRLSDETKARLRMWRAALVKKYEDDIPESLSPAEERRLQRYVQHRVEDIDDEIARATEKVEVQQVERERLRDRRDELPNVSLGWYLRYLLRLATLPTHSDRPEPALGSNGTDRGHAAAGDSLPSARPPVPEEEDGPWGDASADA